MLKTQVFRADRRTNVTIRVVARCYREGIWAELGRLLSVRGELRRVQRLLEIEAMNQAMLPLLGSRFGGQIAWRQLI